MCLKTQKQPTSQLSSTNHFFGSQSVFVQSQQRKCLLTYVCWAKQTQHSFCVASLQRKLGLFQAPVESDRERSWFFRELSHSILINSNYSLSSTSSTSIRKGFERLNSFLSDRKILEALAEFCHSRCGLGKSKFDFRQHGEVHNIEVA